MGWQEKKNDNSYKHSRPAYQVGTVLFAEP